MNWILDGAVAAVIPVRRCGMAKGSDSRGTRLFADGTGAARNESSKPFYRKIFKGDNPV